QQNDLLQQKAIIFVLLQDVQGLVDVAKAIRQVGRVWLEIRNVVVERWNKMELPDGVWAGAHVASLGENRVWCNGDVVELPEARRYRLSAGWRTKSESGTNWTFITGAFPIWGSSMTIAHRRPSCAVAAS